MSEQGDKDQGQEKESEKPDEKKEKQQVPQEQNPKEENLSDEKEQEKEQKSEDPKAEEQKSSPDAKKSESKPSLNKPTKRSLSKKIFIVAGQEASVKDECQQLLKKCGLDPVVFDSKIDTFRVFDTGNKEFSDVAFAIVILSGDTFVYRKSEKPSDAKLRPQPDTVLKLGYFLSHLQKKQVFVMHYEQKSFVFPSAFLGSISIPFNRGDEWKKKLINRLKGCGYTIDENIRI